MLSPALRMRRTGRNSPPFCVNTIRSVKISQTFLIFTRFAFVGWIGASDTNDEGHWMWVNGPEKGQQFWNGDSSQNGGEEVDDSYEHW